MSNTDQATIDDRTKTALTAHLTALIVDKQRAMNAGLARMHLAVESGSLEEAHEALVTTTTALTVVINAMQYAIQVTGTCLYGEGAEKSCDPLAPREKPAVPLPLPFFIRS